jgi:hypothetical protein
MVGLGSMLPTCDGEPAGGMGGCGVEGAWPSTAGAPTACGRRPRGRLRAWPPRLTERECACEASRPLPNAANSCPRLPADAERVVGFLVNLVDTTIVDARERDRRLSGQDALPDRCVQAGRRGVVGHEGRCVLANQGRPTASIHLTGVLAYSLGGRGGTTVGPTVGYVQGARTHDAHPNAPLL